MGWVEKVESLIEGGRLVAAAHLLERHGAMASDDPRVLVAGSRLWCLRGRFGEARALLDRALDIDGASTAALVGRARLAVRLGDDAGACGWFARAREAGAPGDDWMVDWIDALLRRGCCEEARGIAAIRCERAPGDPGTWFRLGLAHQQARHQLQALDAYGHAARLDGRLPMLRNNMGAAYLELGEYGRARELFEATLADDPDHALAWTNLAITLLKTRRVDDSLIAAERACALAPDYPVALQTYSYVLRELQQWPAALETAQRALARAPSDSALVWGVAMLQLLQGDYANGWRSHEARWSGSPELREVVPNLPGPRWEGEPLAGRTLLVWGEQGNGDVLQFVRFVPALARRVKQEGGTLVYCCFEKLRALLARSLGEAVPVVIGHEQRPLPGFDFHLPLASLPLVLGIGVEDLPAAPVAYLRADAAGVNRWKARLPRDGGLRVGVAWTGSREHQRNPMRSIDPALLAGALGGTAGVSFVSLQVEARADAQRAREGGMALLDPTGELDSFDDTAALVASLDLVITVCTSVAHLAGGLGVPTWVLLDVNPHWVWMTGRSDSPWYPHTRLYRQSRHDDWTAVLEAVAADLAVLAGTHGARGGRADRPAA
ncbi:tetratricopeptide repeat protein [Paraburkholderia kururiensis]|uniref:tetratricopeptide repeat protein n=1 Tax=Paraburkholderia kururiensis TaxID=984307 RepID=UPI000F8992E1|nr:tetratricopeptide repeat protein [Paraburkholderia kururiensis]